MGHNELMTVLAVLFIQSGWLSCKIVHLYPKNQSARYTR